MKHSVRIALHPKAKQAQRTGGRQRAILKKLEATTKTKLNDDGGEKQQTQPNVESGTVELNIVKMLSVFSLSASGLLPSLIPLPPTSFFVPLFMSLVLPFFDPVE